MNSASPLACARDAGDSVRPRGTGNENEAVRCMNTIAEVAVALPIGRTFHYSIPERLSKDAAVGKRVRVPFQNRIEIGYIVGFAEKSEIVEVKEVLELIDSEPIVNAEVLSLTKWIADSYFCSWGEAIAAAVPGGLKKGKADVKPGRRTRPEEPRAEPVPASTNLALTEEQALALNEIGASIDKDEHKTFLLHGITASGKTEVYLQAIEWTLKKSRGAIVLVPEISLTPQTAERFVSRFGERVAVIHSALTASKRLSEWRKVRDGRAQIVVGARSAIFSPVKALGLIIVDEEHETSYKQDDVPRYHARDVAEARARLNGCPLLLGSATPSLETYYKAKRGDYVLLELTKRIDDARLPKVKIVDMRLELATRKRVAIFSKMLLDAIDRTVKSGNQVMIFLNRRGFSTFVNCKKCGFVLKCKRCDAVMVYHFQEKSVVCHYCNYTLTPPDICPACKSGYVRYFGLGTERVESELSHQFPGARIARMDSDTTAKRGSHERILGDFKSGAANVLVGTQMIAKGLDFPEVTLVGVVSADVSLNVPDFRASERTFNLITQVAGRAGRRAGEGNGEVIVQTYVPGHYSILAASKHDYGQFYEQEIRARKELLFPPFVNLVKVMVRSRNDDRASRASAELAEQIQKVAPKSVKLSGPAPAPVSRVRGYYRWNILLKGKVREELCVILRQALGMFKKPSGVLIAVDVDPISL